MSGAMSSVPRFWREIPQRYNLEASQCGVCDTIHFPPRRICPTCRRESIGHIHRTQLSGRGRIVEWTRVHRPAPGYEDQVPYVMALIQTDEGPRIMAQIVDVEDLSDADLDGAKVRGVFRRIGSDGAAGIIHYGVKWKVVDDREVLEEDDDASSEE